MSEITISTAEKSDLETILALQKEAYVSEAQIYNDFTIPPLTETCQEINKSFESHIFLKIECEGDILGSVRAYEKGGVCKIGRLTVKKSHQNQGYGSMLLREIESRFPEVSTYELFTGEKSLKNLYLYKKNGYEIEHKQKVSNTLNLVYLRKVNMQATSFAPNEHSEPGC